MSELSLYAQQQEKQLQQQYRSAGQWAQAAIGAAQQYVPNWNRADATNRVLGSKTDDPGELIKALLGVGSAQLGVAPKALPEDEFAWLRRRVGEVCWRQ